MKITNVTQTPAVRKLVVTSIDGVYKCVNGHEGVLQIVTTILYGTLHCCECRTDERVRVELRPEPTRKESPLSSQAVDNYDPSSTERFLG